MFTPYLDKNKNVSLVKTTECIFSGLVKYFTTWAIALKLSLIKTVFADEVVVSTIDLTKR